MRAITGILGAHNGQISNDGKITFTMHNGVAYESIFLYTNLPKEAFRRITVINGTDERIKTTGPRIVDLTEYLWGRDVDLTKDPLPIRFNTIDGQTNDALNAYPLFTTPRDSWLLEIEFGTLPETVPAGGWYVRPKTKTSSLMQPIFKDGRIVGTQPRVERYRRRTIEHRFTAVTGENKFDKTPTGINLMYQAIHIKGDVSNVKFEGYQGGQRTFFWECDKAFNDYEIKTRGQHRGVRPAPGYFNIFPTASGFTLGDMESLNFTRVDLIMEVETAGEIDVIYDLVEVL